MKTKINLETTATEPKQMNLTVQNTDKVVLQIAGVAEMTIDWGDGTEETFVLSAYEDDRGWRETKKLKYKYSHAYPDKSTHTITITGKKITHLRCYRNQMTSLDVSKNTVLEHLDCEANQLISLDVSKNTVLKFLHCFKNQLTSLDVSKNTHLEQLWCGKNQLTGLDMSKNIWLMSLACDANKIAKLNVSKNYRLSSLYCSINKLTSLDVSNNKDLKNLFCFENQLSNLDVSKNSELKKLSCGGNPLTKLDLSENEALRYLECVGNHLTCFDFSENRRIEEFLYFQPNDLEIIQQHFHALMIERAKEGGVTLKTDHLPKITNETFIKTYNGPNSQGISGMYSDFTYRLTERNGKPLLVTESWGKVEYGSGQQHEITVEGYVLVALLELEKMKKRPKTYEDMTEQIRTHKNMPNNDTKSLMEGIEKIEFDVRPFMPLFFGKDRNKPKKADKAEKTARFFLQEHIQTGGKENMVCKRVMKVNLVGKQFDVDLAFGKEGEGISLPQNRHLNDFLLYQTFAGKKNLTELTRNDGIKALCTSLNFSSVMDWMTETSNNSTPPFPVKEYANEGKFRITYYNHDTGWQCTFQGKDGSNTLTVSNFYNSSIPESAKEVYSMDWYKMAHPVRKAASSLVKELRHGQTDKTVRDYFTGRTMSADEKENILFEEVVGNLHDALEDSQYSVEQMMQIFQERCDGQLFDEYAATIKEALNLLNSKTTASREEYIDRLCKSENKVAISVMMIDLKQNMDISRIEIPTEKDLERVERYQKEYEQILAIQDSNTKSA